MAIGAGAEGLIGTAGVAAAVLGTAVAAALWWLYFDIVALVAERRLSHAAVGREQNTVARDSYSYLHLPMVAGIVLVALGMKKTIAHPEDALALAPAVALLGGAVLYLLAHVAFRYRNIHRTSWHRLACAALLLALIPAAVERPALGSVALLSAFLVALLAWETRHFAELRDRLRHQVAAH
jgi:low temperature requirement protein LtrA